MPPLPAWVVVALPLALLLGMLYLAWVYVRRGTSAIHRAASRGDVAALERLLDADPKATAAKDLLGLEPLQYAASWNQLDAAATLLRRGAVAGDGRAWSPMHCAATAGYIEMIALLVEHGGNVNVKYARDDFTPLHAAVVKRRPGAARWLLAHGAAVDAKTKSGWTACHFAALGGDAAMVDMLLEQGADAEARTAAGETPQDVARGAGHMEVAAIAGRRRTSPNSGPARSDVAT